MLPPLHLSDTKTGYKLQVLHVKSVPELILTDIEASNTKLP